MDNNTVSVQDPFHFGSVGRAMFSVLRIETLDTWDQILYIAMFGCEGYPSGYEFLAENDNEGIKCVRGKAFGWIGAFILLFVTIIGAYVLPTVLIGVVSIKFDEQNTYFQAIKEQKKNYLVQLERAKVCRFELVYIGIFEQSLCIALLATITHSHSSSVIVL